MKKITVIGHFAFGHECLNGQTVKTKILTEELERRFGESVVGKMDTHGGKKKLLAMPFMVRKALKDSENVMILPAHNGIRIIAPLLVFFNRFHKRKLHYSVIGGWLPDFLEKRKWLAKKLKKFDYIYVETSTMKKALEKQGFTNVSVVPNCKKLTPLTPDELVYPDGEPYKLCTFSRVMKEKGIEDAVNAVKAVNEKYGRVVYTLDIYGQIDSAQTEWFSELQSSFPEYVRYGGLVPFDKSVEVLKDYFALLFPTRFYTEGIPGTIIDAYAAGVPVISAKWESFADIIDDGKSGFGYDMEDNKAFCDCLEKILIEREKTHEMKKYCLEKSSDYLPQNIIVDVNI